VHQKSLEICLQGGSGELYSRAAQWASVSKPRITLSRTGHMDCMCLWYHLVRAALHLCGFLPKIMMPVSWWEKEDGHIWIEDIPQNPGTTQNWQGHPKQARSKETQWLSANSPFGGDPQKIKHCRKWVKCEYSIRSFTVTN
jgi:hypothetical protein